MNGTRPGRFTALCLIAGITSVAAANWLVDTFGSNVIVVGICAAILAIFLVIAIPSVDDVRTTRRREVSGPSLPRAGSLPSAGGLGQAHRSRTARRRPVHARPLPPEATPPRRRPPPFWL